MVPPKDHVGAVAKGEVTGKGRGLLRDRHALACERGLGDLESRRLDDARIGGDGVAFLDEQNVSLDDLGRQQAVWLPVADHVRVRRRYLLQCGHRRFRPRFLDESDAGVEQYDDADGEGLVRQRRIALVQPQAGRDCRRHEKEHNEDVLELGEQPPPGRRPGVGRQFVGAVSVEPRARFAESQAAVRLGVELRDDRVDRLLVRQGVGGDSPRRGHPRVFLAGMTFSAPSLAACSKVSYA